jgi:lysozyme family protein
MAQEPVIMVADSKRTGIKTRGSRIQGQAARVIIEDAEEQQVDSSLRDQIIFSVLGIEGGWSEDARDSGGRTNYGITDAVARSHGFDVRRMTKEQAISIYVSDYWEPLCLDVLAEICPVVAERLFDIGVNMGIGRAAEWLQRILNALNQNGKLWADVAIDGAIGDETLGAFDAYVSARGTNGCAVLADYLRAMQGHFYIDLAERRPKDEAFVYGWGKRLPDRQQAELGVDSPIQRAVADSSEYRDAAATSKPDQETKPRFKNPLDWLAGWKTHIIALIAAGLSVAELSGYAVPEQVYVLLGALGLSTAYRGVTRNKNRPAITVGVNEK